jgi:hypothetical protein
MLLVPLSGSLPWILPSFPHLFYGLPVGKGRDLFDYIADPNLY